MVAALDLVLNVVILLVVVAAVRAIGTVLVVAFVVTPAATARLVCHRVGPMMADLGYRAFLITASGPQAVDDVCGDPAYAELNFLFAHRDRLGELPFRA